MTSDANRQPALARNAKRVRLVELTSATMTALLAGDLDKASDLAGVVLTDYFLTDKARWIWRLRVDQMAADPRSAPWIARAAVDERTGAVVGYAGFHGQPDEAGMVEVGYSVAPELRRQGYAQAMLAELLARAATEPEVRTVRASISPDNVGSLATVAKFGFVEVGEQWDEIDGRELIFETSVR